MIRVHIWLPATVNSSFPPNKMRLTIVAFVLAALLGLGNAQHCTVACPRSVPTLVVPKAQSTYVYSLDAETVLTPRDTQKVTIKADVEVAIVSVCESVMHLKNVAIEGVPNGAELATKLAEKPFAFGYFNGRIIGVCPAKDEEQWAQNIKKSIISALQIQFDEDKTGVDEMDFSGSCPTNYRKISSADGAVVMEKKKDLNHCHDRRVDLRHTPDQALGQLKELLRHYVHPMDGEVVCKMTLKEQVVSAVKCEERHLLVYRSHKPLHVSNVRMELKETKAGIAENLGETDAANPQPIYLSFDHEHKNPSEADVVEVLKKLCSDISEDNASIETSFTFHKLVHKLRYLSVDETAAVDEAVKTSVCPSAPKRIRELFLDASAFAASDGSIKTLVKAHDNQEMSISRSTASFFIVALRAAPGEETIRSLMPMINSDKTPRPLLLGFSVLVRRYCEKTKDCATNAAMKDVRDAYLTRLANTKNPNERVNLVRALENFNVNTDGVDGLINSLDEIIKSADQEPLIRAASVSALPNDPSHNERFKGLVMDESMPNEVRIAAFHKLVKNGGISHVKDMFGVKDECIKNYLLTYVSNLKNARNPIRKAMLPEDIELPEEPKNKIGISRNIVHEYGPISFEYDIIYPEHENVTRTINMRVTRATKDEVKELGAMNLYQKGFDKEVGNVINLLERNIGPTQFGMAVIKDLTRLVQHIKKGSSEHNHLKFTGRVNGKNVAYGDVFEDLHHGMDLLRKRLEKVIGDKMVDRTIGGAWIDTKVVVPTITGLPMEYKLNKNFVLQYNGKVTGEKGNRNVMLNLSFISGTRGSMKLIVKDQKMAYEYDAALAVTPRWNVDVVKGDHSLVFRLNIQDLDKRTLMKFKQALREKRSTGEESESENELAPEARSDDCFSFFLLDHCRKESQIKGLILPNVEYYVMKPEKEVTALELELKSETEDDKKIRRYVAQLTAVGSPTGKQAKAQIEIVKGEEYKLLLKTPNNEFQTAITIDADQNKNLHTNINIPNIIEADITGKFEKDKETNFRKNMINIDYKFPHDEQRHQLAYTSEFGYNLKRSSKEKVASLDYKSSWTSTRFPITNHKTNILFRYRPLKQSEIHFEVDYGKELEHKIKVRRASNMEVTEMRPFKMTGNSEMELILSDLDVDYDLKSDYKYEGNKGTPLEIQYKIKGKDRSKRAAEHGAEWMDVEGVVDYKNAGSPLDSKMHAHLKIHGNEYKYDSELKQTEPQKYEGKITMSKNDKQIFITHRAEVTKPTDMFFARSEGEITYSDKPDKKNFLMEFKKEKDIYTLKSEVKKNGEPYYTNDLMMERRGKLKWNYKRADRTIDLDVDNIINPMAADMMVNIGNRHYDIHMKRNPFRYTDITIDGNEHAFIKKGLLHFSLVDAGTMELTTKRGSQINVEMDLISPNTKRVALKVDAPVYQLFHEGEVSLSILGRKIMWHATTKREDREYKLKADISRRNSMITFQRIAPERTSNVQYNRIGDKVNMEIDTTSIEGKMEGTVMNGKIHMKGHEGEFEVESTYKYEDGKFIIEPVKSENGKLEGVISRKQPSKLVFESPKVKLHFDYDRFAPTKIYKLHYESPRFEKVTDFEWEPGTRYSYKAFLHTKSKPNKEYNIEINGKPRKAFSMDAEALDFKLKVNKPEDSNKAQFSYTFADYTETDEYEFDPHRAYYLNWLRAIRLYLQNFIVHE